MSEKYPYMKYDEIMKYEDLAKKWKVSEIARGPNGFMNAYKTNIHLTIFWKKKRNSFIARTLAAYIKNPTKRRLLSLIFWAYLPEDEKSKEIIKIFF